MPRKKKPKNYLSLRTICTRTAKLLECPYKDIAALMRKALKGVLKNGCKFSEIMSFRTKYSDIVNFTAIGPKKNSGASKQKGIRLSAQRVRYTQILENGGYEPRERIRIALCGWDEDIRVLAWQDI